MYTIELEDWLGLPCLIVCLNLGHEAQCESKLSIEFIAFSLFSIFEQHAKMTCPRTLFSVMYILCNEEPLWMSQCLRDGGQLEFRDTWKKTTLHRLSRLAFSTVTFRSFLSLKILGMKKVSISVCCLSTTDLICSHHC